MATWLVKTEPEVWSWDDQVKADRTHWDGVRNFQARNNLMAMKLGEQVFFYHSADERRIMGVVKVARVFYPDPTDETGKFGMVDVEGGRPFKTPVTLAQVKADPALADLLLVRNSRLSVMPIDDAAWKRICTLGGVKP